MAGWTTEFHKFHFKYSNDYDSLWDNVNGYDELISDSFFYFEKIFKNAFFVLNSVPISGRCELGKGSQVKHYWFLLFC